MEIGTLLVDASKGSLTLCKWLPESGKPFVIKKREDYGEEDFNIIERTESWLKGYFSGNFKPFEMPYELIGTPFDKKVWNEISTLQYGETISYGDLARRIGNPVAVRAVAGACGRNPIAIIVPCHRVVGSHGKLGGYTGGIERKLHMLKLESVAEGLFKV